MALQQRPEGYFEAKQELQEYWKEDDNVISVEDFPFVWPDTPKSRPFSSSAVTGEIPRFTLILNIDESFDSTESITNNPLDTIIYDTDILDTRKSEPLDLILLRPYLRNGPPHLRKYGPTSLQRAGISLAREPLKGEDGMDIPRETRDVVKAFEKDAKMTARQQDADYLRIMMNRIKNDKPVDLIHSKGLPLYLKANDSLHP
jgi:hypothetical protein